MSALRKSKILYFIFFAILIFGNCFLLKAQATEEKANEPPEKIDELRKQLIIIRDEKPGSADELFLRLEIFRKIIDLSITEASELRTSLLLLNYKEKNEIEWRDETIKKLDEIVNYYNDQKSLIEKEKGLSIDLAITNALEFKNWRLEKYLPISKEINNFFLLKHGGRAQDVARTRLEKIIRDVNRLASVKFKNSDALMVMLKEAEIFMGESNEIYKSAFKIFWEGVDKQKEREEEYQIETLNEAETSEPKIEENVVSQAEPLEQLGAENKEIEKADEKPIISIEDLIKDSLVKIRSSYQIFIEMSDLVR